jgi:hypothetical protein
MTKFADDEDVNFDNTDMKPDILPDKDGADKERIENLERKVKELEGLLEQSTAIPSVQHSQGNTKRTLGEYLAGTLIFGSLGLGFYLFVRALIGFPPTKSESDINDGVYDFEGMIDKETISCVHHEPPTPGIDAAINRYLTLSVKSDSNQVEYTDKGLDLKIDQVEVNGVIYKKNRNNKDIFAVYQQRFDSYLKEIKGAKKQKALGAAE